MADEAAVSRSTATAIAFNYSPLVLLVGPIVGIWSSVDAKNEYKGPVRTIDDIPLCPEMQPPGTPGSPAVAGRSE
ncbi:MAG: hypothetical protein ACLPTJ_06290 [Solirubrobacteraceae bacterium]